MAKQPAWAADQLFEIGAFLALEAGLERVGRFGKHAGIGRKIAVAVAAGATPFGASLANRVDLLGCK
jgi:hypothetical protein